MRLHVWNKPAFGLFDFGTANHSRSFFDYYISKNGFFVLNLETGKVFEAERVGKNSSLQKLKVLEINMEKRQIIDHNKGQDISDCLWMQLVQPFVYYLSVGEVFRFGKQKLIVRSMKTKSTRTRLDSANAINRIRMPETPAPVDPKKVPRMVTLEEQESVEQGSSCRICLEGPSVSDPFVNICPCSKRMPVHLSCVKEWLKKKVKKTRKNNVVYCNLQEIKCELCKTDYPAKIVYQNKEHSLLDFHLEEDKPHILLDICCRDTGVNKGFVVIYFEGTSNKYTVGRGQSNDIVFNDTSVSREHAFLNYDENGISISDRGAKYGTLVKTNAFNYGPFKERFFIQIDKFLFEVHSFKGPRCDCRIERTTLIKDNPFKPIPEIEKNSFLVLDSGSPMGLDQEEVGLNEGAEPVIEIKAGTDPAKPAVTKKEGFLEFGAFKKNRQASDGAKEEQQFHSVLKAKALLSDLAPRPIMIDEGLADQRSQRSGFLEKMGLLERPKGELLEKYKADRQAQEKFNSGYQSASLLQRVPPVLARSLVEEKRANQENRNMPTAIRKFSPVIDSMRFMSNKPDHAQQTRETLFSQLETQRITLETAGVGKAEFNPRSKSEAVLKNCQIISFHNRFDNSRNGLESANESVRVEEKASNRNRLETSTSSAQLMKQSDSWLLKHTAPLTRKIEGLLPASRDRRLDMPLLSSNVSTDQVSVPSKDKLSLTSKYLAFSRTARESPVPSPTPFRKTEVGLEGPKLNSAAVGQNGQLKPKIRAWPEDPYGFSETSNDNFRFY